MIYATPPDQYLQQRSVPRLKGDTNGDLLDWAIDLRTALETERQDKAALRKWKAIMKKENGS